MTTNNARTHKLRYMLSALAAVALVSLWLTAGAGEQKSPSPKSAETNAEQPEAEPNAKPNDTPWPIYRGNRQLQGRASGKLGTDLVRLWKFNAGWAVASSPIVAKGKVYVGSSDANVYAIDFKTGRKVWSFRTGDAVDAPPLYFKDTIYVGSVDANFYALDARTGKKKWHHRAESQNKRAQKIVGSANWTPATKNQPDRVLYCSYDSYLYCIDAKNGNELWRYEAGDRINGAPAIEDKYAIFGGCDMELHRVYLPNGKSRGGAGLDSYVAASAALDGNDAFIGDHEGGFVRANARTRNIAWTFLNEEGESLFSSPALTDTHVIFGGRDGIVYSLDRKQGKKAWIFQTRGQVDSSPVVCDGKVVVGSGDGRLYILDVKTGKKLWSYNLGDGTVSSPAVVDGVIVIGCDDGFVYAFGPKNRKPPEAKKQQQGSSE